MLSFVPIVNVPVSVYNPAPLVPFASIVPFVTSIVPDVVLAPNDEPVIVPPEIFTVPVYPRIPCSTSDFIVPPDTFIFPDELLNIALPAVPVFSIVPPVTSIVPNLSLDIVEFFLV